MRGKKSKELRRLARECSVGLLERKAKGGDWRNRQRTNAENTTRAVYLDLKKKATREARR